MKSVLTNNEQAAKLMIEKSGLPAPSCYKCIFARDVEPHHKFYRRCGVDTAIAITRMKEPLLEMLGKNSRQPLFPIMPVELEDGSTEILPSIIALEFGINTGGVAWPFEFDPIYILWCVFFTTKEEVGDVKQ